MACLECPICFLAFDNNNHRAMQTFCECKRILCLECINQVINHGTGCCPWDRTRWIGRAVLQKFRPAPASSSRSRFQGLSSSSSNDEELLFLDEMGEQAVTREDQVAILLQLEAEAKAKRLKAAEDRDRSFATNLLQGEVQQRLQWRFKSSSSSMSSNSSSKKRERPRTLSPFLKKKSLDIVDLTNDDDEEVS